MKKTVITALFIVTIFVLTACAEVGITNDSSVIPSAPSTEHPTSTDNITSAEHPTSTDTTSTGSTVSTQDTPSTGTMSSTESTTSTEDIPSMGSTPSTEDTDPEYAPPAENATYDFETYADLQKALSELSANSKLRAESEHYGKLYQDTLSAFEKGTVSLLIPRIDGNDMSLRDEEGLSKITFMTNELYNLPWVWYHGKVNGNDVTVCVAYPEIAHKKKLAGVDTCAQAIRAIAPNAPLPENYETGVSYKKVYESTLQLDGNAQVAALVKESSGRDRVYVTFLWEGTMVNVFAKEEVLTEAFWKDFSMSSMEG